MSTCTKVHAPVKPHGTDNHHMNHTSKQILAQTQHNSTYDHEVHELCRNEVTNYTIHPSNTTSYVGGSKHILCPLTNKKYNILSRNGKKIINTYNKHLNSKEKNSCAFSKIKNPRTNRNVSIYGRLGRKIINNYMNN